MQAIWNLTKVAGPDFFRLIQRDDLILSRSLLKGRMESAVLVGRSEREATVVPFWVASMITG